MDLLFAHGGRVARTPRPPHPGPLLVGAGAFSPPCEGGARGGGPQSLGLENVSAIRSWRCGCQDSAASSRRPSPRRGVCARRADEGGKQSADRNRKVSTVSQPPIDFAFSSPPPNWPFTLGGKLECALGPFSSCRAHGCPAHPPWPPLSQGGKVGMHAGRFSICGPRPPGPPPLAPPSQGGGNIAECGPGPLSIGTRHGCPAHPPWPPLHKGGNVGMHARLFFICRPAWPQTTPWPPLHKGGTLGCARGRFPCTPRGCPAHPPWPPLHKGGEIGMHAGLFSISLPIVAWPTPPGPPFHKGGKDAGLQPEFGGCR